MNTDLNNMTDKPMRIPMFRTPARCQNGHFCFLFYTCNFGRCDQTKWVPTCDCPTGGFHQGYQKCGPEQQWTGLYDVKGGKLFEGDIVEHSKYKDTYEVFWSDAGFSVRSPTHITMLSSLCQQYLTVVGNICENEIKEHNARQHQP